MDSDSGGTMARIFRLPYTLGAGAALGAAFLSLPLCFDYRLAMWFNAKFVTTEIPPRRLADRRLGDCVDIELDGAPGWSPL